MADAAVVDHPQKPPYRRQKPSPPSLLELACDCLCSRHYYPHFHTVHGDHIEDGLVELSISDDGGIGVAGTDVEITPRPPEPLFDDASRPLNTGTIGKVRREWKPVTQPPAESDD